MEIKRDIYLKRLIERKNNGFIKIITGIRRCGKSYLLNTIFYNHLIESGVPNNHIIKFAFDSADDLLLLGEDLLELEISKRSVSPKKFIEYVKSQINDNGNYYLLLDEIQKLGAFESVLNGYLRYSNIDIYVTGSNSKFLSKDVLSEFAGRGDEIHVYPLSFSEFYPTRNGSLSSIYDEYMTYGGLPAVALMSSPERKITYLTAQINNLYLRDLIKRYNLKNDNDINELFDILASGIGSLTNPTKLSNTFASLKHSKLTAFTINSYIEYLEDAFIVSKVKRYDVKGKNYINTPYKIYFEDVGLRNAKLNFRQIEPTHLMENIIYNELKFRGYSVDVGVIEVKTKNQEAKLCRTYLEIDFIANLGSNRYYIQSAYAIPDEDKKNQETNSFNHTNDSFKKIILVNESIQPRRDEKGYLMIGVKEFLLSNNSLEY